MNTWNNPNAQIALDIGFLGGFQPEELLYEYELPCIFTFRMRNRGLALAYLADDETDDGLRYIVSTTSETTIEALKVGEISVRDAILRGSMWVVDTDLSLVPLRGYETSLEWLPEDVIPDDATMLWADLEPELVVRLSGESLIQGHIPSAAFSQAADIASLFLKPIVEWALGAKRESSAGRPSAALQQMYSLPIQRVAYGSLIVSFRREITDKIPVVQTEIDLDGQSGETVETGELVHEKIRNALTLGLQWLQEGLPNHIAIACEDDEQRDAILESLKRLAPRTHGPVEQVEVGGALVGRTTNGYRLTQHDTKTINSAIALRKREKPSQLRVFRGRFGEFDRDKLTCIIRDSKEMPGEIACRLQSSDLEEMVLQAFTDGTEVTLSAKSERGGVWTILGVEYTEPGTV